MSDTVARRGPYAKGIAKRRQILREALAAYAESNSDGPSLRSIAARAGLSERGLLHYFGTKDELLVAVLRERDITGRDLIGSADSMEALAAVPAQSAKTPGLVRLFLEMAVAAHDPTHAAHEFFTSRYARLRDVLQPVVSRAPVSPPPPADAAFIARVLVAASDGLQLQWMLDTSIDMRSDMQKLASILVAARAARE